jgi:DNA anti-recombination protein RmuC
MKSAYEIAMERADEVYGTDDKDVNSLEIREELKEIMAPFFKEEMDAEGLWHRLKDKDQEYLKEAQLMLIESIGLRNSSEQIKRRKEAVAAVESLKEGGNTTFFEKQFTQAQSLQQQYQTQKQQLDEQIKQHLEQAQGQGQNPLAAAQSGNDQGQNGMNAQMKQQLAQKVAEFQEGFNKRFNKLIKKMKAEIE